MKYFDVFNGDADGICALHQLRMANPVNGELVTGLKRDILLLEKVNASHGDLVTVLDISLDKNRQDVIRLLGNGCSIDYFDHHFCGEIPDHPSLHATIDTSANICTSLLVNRKLKGKYLPWAVVGAFGDNLHDSAIEMAASLDYSTQKLNALRDLGTYLNYNGYGIEITDLLIHPAQLYEKLHTYIDPFEFIDCEDAYQGLKLGYEEDMAIAESQKPAVSEDKITVFILPDLPWTRRISGVFGNRLARDNSTRAHAILTQLDGGGYRVSVRAPLAKKDGADVLCRSFPTGGGRKAAAGINHLPEEQFSVFLDRFRAAYQY